jgi:hypothetical protein
MMTTEFQQWLRQKDACDEGVGWAAGLTPEQAWATCQKSDWMLWGLKRIGYADDRTLRLFACWCVRQVWDRLTDPRSRAAVETAERYARGDATEEELAAACRSASSAASYAYAYASAAAAYAYASAVASAATAAASAAASDAAAYASADASADAYTYTYAASYTAAAAADNADAYAARAAARAAQADKLRELIPWEAVAALMAKQKTGGKGQ